MICMLVKMEKWEMDVIVAKVRRKRKFSSRVSSFNSRYGNGLH